MLQQSDFNHQISRTYSIEHKTHIGMYEYPHFLYFLLYSLYNDMRSIHNHISSFFSRVTKTYKELISAFPIVLSMSSLLPLLLRPSTRPFQQFLSFPSPSIKSHSLSFFRLLENIQSTKDHTLSYSQPLCSFTVPFTSHIPFNFLFVFHPRHHELRQSTNMAYPSFT